MSQLLKLDAVSLKFGGLQVLHDISFSLQAGEVLGLIGPNGAGKSALTNCICGLYSPSPESRIIFNGSEIGGMPSHRIAGLGVTRTFQHMHLSENMSVLDNVLIGAASQFTGGVLKRYLRPFVSAREETCAREKARDALRKCDIADLADSIVAGLPLGVRRRIDLARALTHTPALLLLDEPASGLANEERALVRDLVGIAQKHNKVGVIWIEHDLELVVSAATRIIVLHHGRIVAEGAPTSADERKRLIDAYLAGSTSN